jgi:hypothetical protein
MIFPAADAALVSPAPNLLSTAKKEQEQELDLLEAIQHLDIEAASSATTPSQSRSGSAPVAPDLCFRHEAADAISSLPRSEEHEAELPPDTPKSAARRTAEQRSSREFGSMFPMSVAKRDRSPVPS